MKKEELEKRLNSLKAIIAIMTIIIFISFIGISKIKDNARDQSSMLTYYTKDSIKQFEIKTNLELEIKNLTINISNLNKEIKLLKEENTFKWDLIKHYERSEITYYKSYDRLFETYINQSQELQEVGFKLYLCEENIDYSEIFGD